MSNVHMTIEQLQYAVLFILALVLAFVGAHYMRQRKIRFKYPVAVAVLLFISISTFFTRSFEGDAIGIFFLWISCILGLSLALDILTLRGRDLSEWLVVGSWLAVTSVGGILTNMYIFSVPTSVVTRILSFSVLILTHVPMLVALIAYVKGKRELSRRLINPGYAA